MLKRMCGKGDSSEKLANPGSTNWYVCIVWYSGSAISTIELATSTAKSANR